MIESSVLWIFAAAALVMVLTPGPNMIYLISRSVCQGKRAGVISLLGVIAGFLIHVFAAALGLTAVLDTVPVLYDLLKWLGATYLLWLAWQAVRPRARSPFAAVVLAEDSDRKLFLMGLLTNALNPKIAIFYLSIFPQFVSIERGSVFAQSIGLGAVQIFISFGVNLAIVLSAGQIAWWFQRNPTWLAAQRYVLGSVLAALAIRLVCEERRRA